MFCTVSVYLFIVYAQYGIGVINILVDAS